MIENNVKQLRKNLQKLRNRGNSTMLALSLAIFRKIGGKHGDFGDGIARHPMIVLLEFPDINANFHLSIGI